MKPSVFIIDHICKELINITQKKCLVHKPKELKEEYLYLELMYSPLDLYEEELQIHFLLSYFHPQSHHPEALLHEHITLNAALKKIKHISITSEVEAHIHTQPVKDSHLSSDSQAVASWLIHARFNPQNTHQLIYYLDNHYAS